jgi:hypothetical protein
VCEQSTDNQGGEYSTNAAPTMCKREVAKLGDIVDSEGNLSKMCLDEKKLVAKSKA